MKNRRIIFKKIKLKNKKNPQNNGLGFYKIYYKDQTDPVIIYISSENKTFEYLARFTTFINYTITYNQLLKLSESKKIEIDRIEKTSRSYDMYVSLIKELDPNGYRILILKIIKNPIIR